MWTTILYFVCSLLDVPSQTIRSNFPCTDEHLEHSTYSTYIHTHSKDIHSAYNEFGYNEHPGITNRFLCMNIIDRSVIKFSYSEHIISYGYWLYMSSNNLINIHV